ncbi:MAG: AraC family transcriptional regulator [Lachnospiraceae bacterium]|nr:AraC family transcriptional regulator [Lachnospiraceae bacterium]
MNASKTGYLNDNFKMFHLTDNLQKTYDYHYHDFIKILLFISGDVTYCIEGRSYVLQPYDVVLVDAGEVHRPVINSPSTYERIIIYVSSEFLSSYTTEQYDLGYCLQKAREEHSHVLRCASLSKSRLYQVSRELEQSFGDQDFAGELYSRLLFLEFMIQLNRASIHDSISYAEMDCASPKILEVMQYINTNLGEELSIDQLSAMFYLSKYYLMHSFKEETGYTIGNYITAKRLFLARELIQAGRTITEACFESGFKNYSSFSRAYKKMYHEIPRDLLKEDFIASAATHPVDQSASDVKSR